MIYKILNIFNAVLFTALTITLVVVLQIRHRNMLLTIAAGTGCVILFTALYLMIRHIFKLMKINSELSK